MAEEPTAKHPEAPGDGTGSDPGRTAGEPRTERPGGNPARGQGSTDPGRRGIREDGPDPERARRASVDLRPNLPGLMREVPADVSRSDSRCVSNVWPLSTSRCWTLYGS
jgi:hypothetical protein